MFFILLQVSRILSALRTLSDAVSLCGAGGGGFAVGIMKGVHDVISFLSHGHSFLVLCLCIKNHVVIVAAGVKFSDVEAVVHALARGSTTDEPSTAHRVSIDWSGLQCAVMDTA